MTTPKTDWATATDDASDLDALANELVERVYKKSRGHKGNATAALYDNRWHREFIAQLDTGITRCPECGCSLYRRGPLRGQQGAESWHCYTAATTNP
jgi:hypothetical protein